MIHLGRRFAGRRLFGVVAAATLWSVSPSWLSTSLEARAYAQETSRQAPTLACPDAPAVALQRAVSENMSQMAHAHPSECPHAPRYGSTVELVPDGEPAARAGPTLTFRAALPEAGTYRIWTPIKRRGEIATAVFTVRAEPEPRGALRSQGRVDLRHSR